MHSTSSSENWPSASHFLVRNPELLAGVLVQLVAIVQQATDVGADLDVILAQRLGVQHGVVGHHFVDLQRRHANARGDFVDQFLGHRADFVLRVHQHRNHRGTLPSRRIALQHFVKPGFKLRRKCHYLSVSPSTKSMLPMAAITSAIRVPSTILGTACRLPKLGVRMCTR